MKSGPIATQGERCSYTPADGRWQKNTTKNKRDLQRLENFLDPLPQYGVPVTSNRVKRFSFFFSIKF